jgi:hypothetical protein
MDVMGKADTVIPVKSLSKMSSFTPNTSGLTNNLFPGLASPFYVAKLHVRR